MLLDLVGVLCVGVRLCVCADLWEGLRGSITFWLLSSFIFVKC